MFNTASANPQASAHIQNFFTQIWNTPSLQAPVVMISGALIGGMVILAVIRFSNKD